MKLSKYVRVIPYKESLLLYNTFGGALVRVPQKIIVDSKVVSDNAIQKLEPMKFFATDSEVKNELEEDLRIKENTLDLSIELTTKCNFHCDYCYQLGDEFVPSHRRITNTVIQDILEYTEECLANEKLSKLMIGYIGGEPLLEKKKLLDLHYGFMNLAQKYDVLYYPTINTNGSLIDNEFLSNFQRLGISITLSLPSDHNKHRKYGNDKLSFDDIINNIRIIKELKSLNNQIGLSIRYNVNKENYQDFGKFLEFLEVNNLRPDQINVINTEKHVNTDFSEVFDYKKFTDWMSTTAIKYLLQNNYKITNIPSTWLGMCKAYRKNNAKIYADGSTTLCDGHYYQDRGPTLNELGNKPSVLNEFFKTIKDYNPLEDVKCKDCKDLILCRGQFICKSQPCKYEQFALDPFIISYYESIKNEQSHLFVHLTKEKSN